MRRRRFTFVLDPATESALRQRAAAHNVSQAAFLRSAIVGARPGGGSGETASSADAWWDTLPPSRRAQVHAWLTQRHSSDDTMPGQLEIDAQEAV